MLTRRSQVVFWAGLAAGAVASATSVYAGCTAEWQPGTGVPGILGKVNAAVMWDPDAGGSQQPVLVVGGDFTLADSTLVSNIAYWNGSSWSGLGAGFNSTVNALTVYNGVLVAGGSFTASGANALGSIARWNGSAWTRFSTGTTIDLDSSVNSLAVANNGDLIAGGSFFFAGNNGVSEPTYVAVHGLARWTGTQWRPLNPSAESPGVENGGSVDAMAIDASGRLIVGGYYLSVAGNAGIQYISRWTWTGTEWAPASLGSSIDATVTAVATSGNDVIAGGFFTSAGQSIARWNDAASTWNTMSIGLISAPSDLLVLPGGDVIAGGSFTYTGSFGMSNQTLCLGLARWNGSTWSPMWPANADPARSVGAIVWKSNGDLVIGGNFHSVGDGLSAHSIAQLSGTTWSSITNIVGTGDEITALKTLSNGDVVAGGRFQTIAGVAAKRVARWTGTTWSPMGAGLFHPSNTWPLAGPDVVASFVELPGGTLVVGGHNFATTAGGAQSIIARWNGSVWTNFLPSIEPGPAYAILGLPDFGVLNSLAVMNGDLIASANPAFLPNDPDELQRYLVRWDGAQWSDTGSLTSDIAREMVVLPNDGLPDAGNLVAGGWSSNMDSVTEARHIARWDGESYLGSGTPDWQPLGQGLDSGVNTILLLPNGDLVVGGAFTAAGNAEPGDTPASKIARWNRATSTWTALASGLNGDVNALALMPNGDIIAGGGFSAAGNAAADDTPVNNLARWNGTSWSALGEGVDGVVSSLAVDGNGDLIVGGRFTTAGGLVSPYLARWACGGSVCAADFNGVNGVTVQDIFDFLTAWLAGSSGADFNGVNGVTVQDIFDFLTAWLAGC